MNKYHAELLNELKIFPKVQDKDNYWYHTYIGSRKISYKINAIKKKELVKNWLKKHPQLSSEEYIQLLNSLYDGKIHTEISIAGKILEFTPKLRKYIKPGILDKWLSNVEGWAEVDSLCQSNFTSDEMLDKWKEWKKLLISLSKNDNVHKRRASLVLLTGPVRHSTDPKLVKLSFINIDRLKGEKDILITKAISWLLRDLIKYNRNAVEIYLEMNKDQLPKIAIRETKRKLLTGRK
jgi:3-methyladenine DNA glycosylase AlkD